MLLTRKQEIYMGILDRILPSLRNVESNFWRNRADVSAPRFGNSYPELELVHYLHRQLLFSEFNQGDIHWLNSQARFYFKHGQNDPHYEVICKLIAELFTLVPKELEEKLDWRVP